MIYPKKQKARLHHTTALLRRMYLDKVLMLKRDELVRQLGSKTPGDSDSRPYLGFGTPPFRNTCRENNNKGVSRKS